MPETPARKVIGMSIWVIIGLIAAGLAVGTVLAIWRARRQKQKSA